MKTLLIKAGLILKGTVKHYIVASGTNVQWPVFSETCYFIAWYCTGSNLHQTPKDNCPFQEERRGGL